MPDAFPSDLAIVGGRDFVNPPGFDWVGRSVVHRRCVLGFQSAWRRFLDVEQLLGDDDVSRASLDPWQKFAHDILMSGRVGSRPRRCFLIGGPGTGKTRTIRAVVGSKRAAVRAADGDDERVAAAVQLCAPTGSASFHLKYGAATLHCTFGVPVGKFKVWGDRRHPRLLKIQRKLKHTQFSTMDELSMIGGQMLGKSASRCGEVFGTVETAFGSGWLSFGGKDVLLAGDPKQCQPIGDDPVYKDGEYIGRGLRRGDTDDGVVPAKDLSNRGLAIRKEFDECVILQQVWRLDDGDDSMPVAVREAYRAEADEFPRVTRAMANWD